MGFYILDWTRYSGAGHLPLQGFLSARLSVYYPQEALTLVLLLIYIYVNHELITAIIAIFVEFC